MQRSTVARRRRAPRRGAPRGRSRPSAAVLAATAVLVAAVAAVVTSSAACGDEPGATPTGDAAATASPAESLAAASPAPRATPAVSDEPAPPTTPEALLQERVLLLQGYIETYALRHYYEYPGPGMVRKGGALPAPLWPRDPWTGRNLRPGTAPGTYTYTVAADRRSYRLVGHLPGGDFEVGGAMPSTALTAYRHREQEGLSLIRQYVIEWAQRHGGLYPPATEVSREGGVGAPRGDAFWPSNPWNHGPMIQSRAVGDFGYEVAADRSWCRLTLHTSPTSDWTLECDALEQ